MKDNIIYTDNDDAIGFYKDLYAVFVSQVIDLLNRKDIENAQTQLENLSELSKLSNYDGLIIVSDCNGMGFLAKPYKGEENE